MANNLFLHRPVGPRQPNDPLDVKAVQTFLNRHSHATRITLFVDGHFDHNTERAINQFQRKVLGILLPDGTIPVIGPVLEKLRKANIRPASVAVPLKTDDGTVVTGANGQPALVPEPFDIKAVLKQGVIDKVLRKTDIPIIPGYPISQAVGLEKTLLDLANFRRDGRWDIQRLDGIFDTRYIDAATILIGMFAACAGLSEAEILTIENTYAKPSDHPGATMDPKYSNLPLRNVKNTTIGFDLINSGAIKP